MRDIDGLAFHQFPQGMKILINLILIVHEAIQDLFRQLYNVLVSSSLLKTDQLKSFLKICCSKMCEFKFSYFKSFLSNDLFLCQIQVYHFLSFQLHHVIRLFEHIRR